MKLFKMFFRDEQQCSVTVCETWEVRWTSRYDIYHDNIRPEVRVFICKDEAEKFKSALEDAFKLINHTSQCEVTLTKIDM